MHSWKTKGILYEAEAEQTEFEQRHSWLAIGICLEVG